MSWIKTAEQAVLRALCAALLLDPESPEAASRLRIAYQSPVTAPQARSDQNVCYIALSETIDGAAQSVEVTHQSDSVHGLVAVVRKTIPITCLCTFYGADADEDAEAVWSRLMVDTGNGSPRDILRKSGMVIVPYPERPVSLPELEGSLWRRRSDLRFRLNMIASESLPAAYVDAVPDMTIKKG